MVLASIRLTGTVYFSALLQGPIGVAIPARRRAPFYYLAEGALSLDAPGGETIRLNKGDLVFLLDSGAHALRVGVGAQPLAFETFTRSFPMDERGGMTAVGGEGPIARVIGGFFEFEGAGAGLVDALPATLFLSGDRPDVQGWLAATIALILTELERSDQGRSVVLSRLAEVLLVQSLRAALSGAAAPLTPGWLKGLSDPGVARALFHIHRAPEEAWTLPRLAEEARMSRASFASRFRGLVGQPPAAYLTALRLREAAALLAAGLRPISRVAEAVGYGSELAFNKAFRRQFGQPPGAYRRAAAPCR